MAIDLNRGVTSRTEPRSGMRVHMYKDTPGVFLDAHAHEVDVSLAKRAGFNVNGLVKLRRMQEAKDAAYRKIEAEFSAQSGAEKVIKEKQNYKIVSHGFGRHSVLGPDGEKMNVKGKYLTKKEAEYLLESIVGAETELQPEGEETADGAETEA